MAVGAGNVKRWLTASNLVSTRETVVVLKEVAQAKVGVTLTRHASDSRPVFVKITEDGAAARPPASYRACSCPAISCWR